MDEKEREWRSKAFCLDTDPNVFFPVAISAGRGSKGIRHQIEAEVRDPFCLYCVVKEECLEYAIVNNQRDGIWGDTTSEERREIIRNRKAAKKKVAAS